MNSRNNHIIEKVFLEVNTKNIDFAYSVRDNARSFLDDIFLPVLEAVLEKYNISDTVLRFDRLDVDISTGNAVSLDDTENMKFYFRSQFEDVLKQHISGVESSMGDMPAGNKILQNESIEKNIEKVGVEENSFESNARRRTVQDNRKSIFLFFLENGSLPWYGKKDDITGFVSSKEWGQSLEDPGFLSSVTFLISSDRGARIRFTEYLSDDAITKFLIRKSSDSKGVLSLLEKIVGTTGTIRHAGTSRHVRTVKHAGTTRHAKTVQDAGIIRGEGKSPGSTLLKMLVELSLAKSVNEVQKILVRFEKEPFFTVIKRSWEEFEQMLKNILPVEVQTDVKVHELLDVFSRENRPATEPTILKNENKKVFEEKNKEEEETEYSTTEEKSFFPHKTGQKEISVKNAGLILLHPFFKSLFSEIGVLDKNGGIVSDKTDIAVQTLHFIAAGDEDFFEGDLVLDKFLCNVPLKWPVTQQSQLTDAIKSEVNVMLKEVIKHWPALKNTSPEGLRQMFIARDGKLIEQENGFKLIVERKAQDVLLEKLNWNISMVKLPWRKELITVEW